MRVQSDCLYWESPAGARASIAVSSVGASACIGRSCCGSGSRATESKINTSIIEVRSSGLHSKVGGDLLIALTVRHMGRYSSSSQASAGDSSCTVVRVTTRGVALYQATKNGGEGKNEEEVELHDVQMSSVALDFGSVFFKIG